MSFFGCIFIHFDVLVCMIHDKIGNTQSLLIFYHSFTQTWLTYTRSIKTFHTCDIWIQIFQKRKAPNMGKSNAKVDGYKQWT
jgi:hypothetical protein